MKRGTDMPIRVVTTMVTLSIAAAAAGCSSAGYTVTIAPTMGLQSFRHVEVAEVSAAITEDTLASGTGVIFRSTIIEAIAKERMFESASAKADADSGVLTIGCEIKEFSRGSQGSRWLSGGLAGSGHMKMTCAFTAKETGHVFAEADFEKNVRSGWFGGRVTEENLAKDMGKQIAKFLEEGG